jgi:hypothetical protein
MIACVWMAGLATIFEREGRQKELAAYCLTHALDSIYGFLKQRRLVSPNDWVSGITTVLAFATLLHHHHQQPQFVSKILFGIREKCPEVV